jgi:hypothetical protein
MVSGVFSGQYEVSAKSWSKSRLALREDVDRWRLEARSPPRVELCSGPRRMCRIKHGVLRMNILYSITYPRAQSLMAACNAHRSYPRPHLQFTLQFTFTASAHKQIPSATPSLPTYHATRDTTTSLFLNLFHKGQEGR